MNIGVEGWEEKFFDVEYAIQGRGMYALTLTDSFFPLVNEQDFLRAYRSCPTLKTITSKRAKLFNTGVFEVQKADGSKIAEGATAKYVRDLTSKPNPLQHRDQFFAQQNVYVDIFGYCPVLGIPSLGLPGQYSMIWNIPPWLFDIDYTRKWLMQNKVEGIYKKYFMLWEGDRMELDMRNLFFVFDDGVGTEMDTNLTIPDSRLVGLDYVVGNIVAAMKSRNTLITRRGAMGILSNDSGDKYGQVPFSDGETERLQSKFKNYGLVGQPFQVIITEAALKWQQMGYPTKDLMLFEEVEADTEMLCDAYGYPIELMARSKGTTFNNKDEAKRAVFRDTIMPESESRMGQFTVGLMGEGSTVRITRNFRDVPALQQDAKAAAEALKALNEALQIEWMNNLITRNMWLEKIGEDQVDNEDFNKYRNELTPDVQQQFDKQKDDDKGSPPADKAA